MGFLFKFRLFPSWLLSGNSSVILKKILGPHTHAPSIFIVSMITGAFFTSMLLFTETPSKKHEPIVLYENKYYDEYLEKEVKELTSEELDNLTNKMVEDDTPQGVVYMEYSAADDTFIWYASSGITDKNLNTVVRKFVCKFDCAILYYNIHDAILEENKRHISAVKQQSNELPELVTELPELVTDVSPNDCAVAKETPKSVFASFKKYKTGGELGKISNSDGTVNFAKTKLEEEHAENVKNIKKRINRFRRGGNLIDYDTIVLDRKNVKKPYKPMTFSMFQKNKLDTPLCAEPKLCSE